MPDRLGHPAQRFNYARIDAQCRERRRSIAAGQFDCISLYVIGQVLIRSTTWLAKYEEHRQGYVSSLVEGVGQTPVGIELLISLDQQSLDLRTG